MGTSEPLKYFELRAKTDRQLIAVIRTALSRGMDAARRLSASNCNGNSDRLRHLAETAFAEAVTLLPLVYDWDEAERAALETRVNELRAYLEGCEQPLVRSAGGA